MTFGEKITRFSVDHYRGVTWAMVIVTVVIALVAALPSIWPQRFPYLNSLKVDTDPENMLPKDEPVRVFHNRMKRVFNLYDIVVVGVVNEKDPDGVFNPKTLSHIYQLTQYAKTLQWKDPKDPGKTRGVIAVDLIAPSTVDNIEQGGPGTVRFEWLMPRPPKTRKEALAIKAKAERLPFLKNTLISQDGKAICLYLPISSKRDSYRIYTSLKKRIAQFKDKEEHYYITGLPVAEDDFGVEMFTQMAISAPMAMVIIFLLMFYFFRKLVLIISPMILAMVSVIFTMGLLVATGHTVHIMSSMIPIFVMPIAVLDSIHILSEFFDRYPSIRDRKKTIVQVMSHLFMPMLYTSLTSAAGFASEALAPIPPVQVFGIFVAIGVMYAWVLTVTFIPAYVMFIPESSLENFGHKGSEHQGGGGLMSRLLPRLGVATYRRYKLILTGAAVIMAVAVYGISLIQVNDNPVKWFTKGHPIRVADTVLNRHFGGTYMAYLSLAPAGREDLAAFRNGFVSRLKARVEKEKDIPGIAQVFDRVKAIFQETKGESPSAILKAVTAKAQELADAAPDDQLDAWDEAMDFLDRERQRSEVFKDPAVLRYISKLQKYMATVGVVGKTNSIADLVKTVHRELLMGKEKEFRIPDTSDGVAQCLITYQNSHRPQDLWHFVTPDFRRVSIWFQLRSGDNKDMRKVERAVSAFMAKNPPPVALKAKWFGLTYINVVWQEKMVIGMLTAFLGSFLVVYLMMMILYQSPLWGILCMIPLTVTIGFIYGTVGLVGKDYDMPIAVLSSLTLGLAVDFAIHFLSRTRSMVPQYGSWGETVGVMFEEPARAITRNIIVIAVGFLPLLLAPLVPYRTVGIFMATILAVAGVATLVLLPALVRAFEKRLFPEKGRLGLTCSCWNCMVLAAATVATIVVNVYQYINWGWNRLAAASAVVLAASLVVCCLASRRKLCQRRKAS